MEVLIYAILMILRHALFFGLLGTAGTLAIEAVIRLVANELEVPCRQTGDVRQLLIQYAVLGAVGQIALMILPSLGWSVVVGRAVIMSFMGAVTGNVLRRRTPYVRPWASLILGSTAGMLGGLFFPILAAEVGETVARMVAGILLPAFLGMAVYFPAPVKKKPRRARREPKKQEKREPEVEYEQIPVWGEIESLESGKVGQELPVSGSVW